MTATGCPPSRLEVAGGVDRAGGAAAEPPLEQVAPGEPAVEQEGRLELAVVLGADEGAGVVAAAAFGAFLEPAGVFLLGAVDRQPGVVAPAKEHRQPVGQDLHQVALHGGEPRAGPRAAQQEQDHHPAVAFVDPGDRPLAAEAAQGLALLGRQGDRRHLLGLAEGGGDFAEGPAGSEEGLAVDLGERGQKAQLVLAAGEEVARFDLERLLAGLEHLGGQLGVAQAAALEGRGRPESAVLSWSRSCSASISSCSRSCSLRKKSRCIRPASLDRAARGTGAPAGPRPRYTILSAMRFKPRKMRSWLMRIRSPWRISRSRMA